MIKFFSTRLLISLDLGGLGSFISNWTCFSLSPMFLLCLCLFFFLFPFFFLQFMFVLYKRVLLGGQEGGGVYLVRVWKVRVRIGKNQSELFSCSTEQTLCQGREIPFLNWVYQLFTMKQPCHFLFSLSLFISIRTTRSTV